MAPHCEILIARLGFCLDPDGHGDQAAVFQPLAPDAQVQDALLAVYRSGGVESSVCERLLDLDEGLQEWRYRHVKMVERVIGAKIGTGGSAGAAYLRETLFKPLFADLWEIRSRL